MSTVDQLHHQEAARFLALWSGEQRAKAYTALSNNKAEIEAKADKLLELARDHERKAGAIRQPVPSFTWHDLITVKLTAKGHTCIESVPDEYPAARRIDDDTIQLPFWAFVEIFGDSDETLENLIHPTIEVTTR